MLSLTSDRQGPDCKLKEAILDVMRNGQPYMAIYSEGQLKAGILLTRESLWKVHRWSGDELKTSRRKLSKKDIELADTVARTLFTKGRTQDASEGIRTRGVSSSHA